MSLPKQIRQCGIDISCADCLAAYKKLEDNSIDLIATDPPYFLDGMDNNWSDDSLKTKAGKARAVGGLPVGMKFDPNQGKKLAEFFNQVAAESVRVLKPGGFFLSFAQGRLYHRLACAVEDAGFEIRDMLIWEHGGGQGKAFTQDHFVDRMKISAAEKTRIKNDLQGRKTPQLRPKFEAILLAQKPKDGTFVQNWLKWQTGLIKTDFPFIGQQTTVFNFPKPKKAKFIDHMTVKPVDLMGQLIDVFSLPGQIVLDPFMGSGSTGVAALSLRRQFVGFEIEPKYYKIAYQRLIDDNANRKITNPRGSHPIFSQRSR